MKRSGEATEERDRILKEWADADLSANQFIRERGLDLTPNRLYSMRRKAEAAHQLRCKLCGFEAAGAWAIAAHYRTAHRGHKKDASAAAVPATNGPPAQPLAIHCPHCGRDVLAEYERIVMMLRAVGQLKAEGM